MMQLFKRVVRVQRHVKMCSPNVHEQLSLCGERPPRSPPKLFFARNSLDNNLPLLDTERILAEARELGATEAEIQRFFLRSVDAQQEELLSSENTAEPQASDEDDESYLTRRIAQRAEWYSDFERQQKQHEQSQAQSERDKTPKRTPNGTCNKRRSTPQGTPDTTTPGSTPPSRRQLNKQERLARQKDRKSNRSVSSEQYSSKEEWIEAQKREGSVRKARRSELSREYTPEHIERTRDISTHFQMSPTPASKISAENARPTTSAPVHRPLVLDLKKPPAATTMDATKDSGTAAQLNHEIEKDIETNAATAAPGEATNKPKKDKAPKQPKAQKAAPPTAPLTPAVIDLRVGHILRAVEHPNADTMYVSTIAMGDPEGAEHTEVDEQTGKVVRTVCSGLKAYVPLAEMQDRKIIVVANLKPANLRSIKSAAMVLAASPKPEEGADSHSPDRIVELVQPPEGSEAGDKVYFEGWPYGEGKGPEKQLNPKKKMWEALQPGFYTTDDLVVAFDARNSEMEEKSGKGELVVEGKGKCTVKSLKGAVVR